MKKNCHLHHEIAMRGNNNHSISSLPDQMAHEYFNEIDSSSPGSAPPVLESRKDFTNDSDVDRIYMSGIGTPPNETRPKHREKSLIAFPHLATTGNVEEFKDLKSIMKFEDSSANETFRLPPRFLRCRKMNHREKSPKENTAHPTSALVFHGLEISNSSESGQSVKKTSNWLEKGDEDKQTTPKSIITSRKTIKFDISGIDQSPYALDRHLPTVASVSNTNQNSKLAAELMGTTLKELDEKESIDSVFQIVDPSDGESTSGHKGMSHATAPWGNETTLTDPMGLMLAFDQMLECCERDDEYKLSPQTWETSSDTFGGDSILQDEEIVEKDILFPCWKRDDKYIEMNDDLQDSSLEFLHSQGSLLESADSESDKQDEDDSSGLTTPGLEFDITSVIKDNQANRSMLSVSHNIFSTGTDNQTVTDETKATMPEVDPWLFSNAFSNKC